MQTKDDQLQLMLTGARDTAVWISDRLREWSEELTAPVTRTHWVGCEASHPECALVWAAGKIDPRIDDLNRPQDL